jgi:hypothetical protein
MTKPAKTPLHEARRKAAKELNLPVGDQRVIRLATLQCAYDAAQAQLMFSTSRGKAVRARDRRRHLIAQLLRAARE